MSTRTNRTHTNTPAQKHNPRWPSTPQAGDDAAFAERLAYGCELLAQGGDQDDGDHGRDE